MNGFNFAPFYYSAFDPAQAVRLPEPFHTMIESGVGNGRASNDKATQYAKDNLKTVEKIVSAAQTGSKEIGEKVFDHAKINAKAVFEAAAALARARTFPELARVQTTFVQQQLTAAQAQSQELFQLSARLAQQTFATFNSAIAENFEQLKKAD